jgi:hypothetical protein
MEVGRVFRFKTGVLFGTVGGGIVQFFLQMMAAIEGVDGSEMVRQGKSVGNGIPYYWDNRPDHHKSVDDQKVICKVLPVNEGSIMIQIRSKSKYGLK